MIIFIYFSLAIDKIIIYNKQQAPPPKKNAVKTTLLYPRIRIYTH